MAQQSDSQLITQSEVIRNETSKKGNTKARVADMVKNVVESKINNDKIKTTLDTPNDLEVPSTLAVKKAVTNTRQVLLDAATIQWNYSLGNVGFVAIAASRAISISNVTGVMFGILEVRHTVAGTTIALPGDSENVSWNPSLNGTTLLGFFYNGVSYIWTSNVGGAGSSPPADSEVALVWAQFTQSSNGSNGTLNFNNAALPNGATATQRLGGVGSYVQFTIPSNLADGNAIPIEIAAANDSNYAWGSPTHLLAVYYNTSGNLIYYANANSQTPNSLGVAPAAGNIIRLERTATDDITIKLSTNGGTSFTTLSVRTGVLAGQANPYIKALNAVQGAGKMLFTAKGKSLV